LNDDFVGREGGTRSENDVWYNTKVSIANVRREVESMTKEKEILNRHVKSMRRRIHGLENVTGLDSSSDGGEMDQLTVKVDEIYQLVISFV